MLGQENECGHVHHHNAGEGEGGEGRRQEDTGGIVRVMERRQEPNFSGILDCNQMSLILTHGCPYWGSVPCRQHPPPPSLFTSVKFARMRPRPR
jgi:hypothetical protein